MRRPVHKGFRMLKFLNRKHSALLRGPVAVLAYAAALLATGRSMLASEIAARCWREDDFELAARRGSWYFRRGWLGLDVSQDDFFDVTRDMNNAQLNALESFVEARKAKLEPDTYAGDRIFIAGRRLDINAQTDQRDELVSVFEARCNALLEQPVSRAAPATQAPHTPDFPIESAKQTLSDFMALFPQADLPWFLVSGTFLGLVREKGFLPHDYDIDLGVFEDRIDIDDTIQIIAKSDQFVLISYDHRRSTIVPPPANPTNPDVPYILKIMHQSGVRVDLFVHYRDNSQTQAVDWHGSSLHRWENSAFELASYDFYGWKVLAPADADRYLRENYGDWRTPVTDFNCTTDTTNLALVRHPIAVATFLKRFALNRHTNPAEAAKLRSSLVSNGFLHENQDNGLRFSGALFRETP